MPRVLIFSTYIFFTFFHCFAAQAAIRTNGTCPRDFASSCNLFDISYIKITCDTLPAPPPEKKGILKKIGDFFKFRKNADARWVARVKRVIDTLGLVAAISAEKDSILRIHKLTSNFTDSERVYYQTLLVLLNNIDKASSSITAKSRNGPPPGGKSTDSTFSPVMDDDMQTLIDKIVDRTPRTEEPDTTMSSKAAWLAALSRIESTRTYSDTIGDTLRRYRVGLKKKLQIYGFHNATANAKYNGYRFDRISTLVYNSLIIEPNGVIKPRGWDTARVLKDAEAAGVGIVANFMMQNKGNIASFLGNSKARSDFIQLAMPLLKKYKTTGVNIIFDGLQPGNAGDFVSFIAELRNSKGFGDSLYQIFITLPIADRSNCFDLTSLDKLTDFFIINFSADPEHPPIGSGPVFPLSGGQDNSIRTRLSALTNTGLKQSKLIVGIPYFGAKWKVSGTTGAGRFLNTWLMRISGRKTQNGRLLQTFRREPLLWIHHHWEVRRKIRFTGYGQMMIIPWERNMASSWTAN